MKFVNLINKNRKISIFFLFNLMMLLVFIRGLIAELYLKSEFDCGSFSCVMLGNKVKHETVVFSLFFVGLYISIIVIALLLLYKKKQKFLSYVLILPNVIVWFFLLIILIINAISH